MPLAALAQARQATPDDYVLLTASSKLGEEDTPGNPLSVWGVSLPLLDTDVLTESEVAIVDNARNQFNATIEAAAAADVDLLLLDAETLLRQLNESGINYGSGGISATFVQGGGFSADGVHPTARGYAVIANEIIKVINGGFNANVAPVDPNQFSTVFFQ